MKESNLNLQRLSSNAAPRSSNLVLHINSIAGWALVDVQATAGLLLCWPPGPLHASAPVPSRTQWICCPVASIHGTGPFIHSEYLLMRTVWAPLGLGCRLAQAMQGTLSLSQACLADLPGWALWGPFPITLFQLCYLCDVCAVSIAIGTDLFSLLLDRSSVIIRWCSTLKVVRRAMFPSSS